MDQIKGLSDEALNEVFTKVITAANPNAQRNKINFDYNTGEYKLETTIDHLAVHFAMKGDLISVDSEEASAQKEYTAKRATEQAETKNAATATEGDTYDPEKPPQALKNPFVASDRATQTFKNPMRNKDICTEPPNTADYSGSVNKWDIYDTYLEDCERKKALAEEQDKKPTIGKKKLEGEEDEVEMINLADNELPGKAKDERVRSTREMVSALQVMERVVHTASDAECFHDYKYFEDKNELKREDGKGSFLPLWRLNYERAHRKNVTGLCWNPVYQDLLAVAYGSYDFSKQSTGMICCFTLKNTSHPEYVFETPSGVCSLDFHPTLAYLLCVGLYNGQVAVFDARRKSRQDNPIHIVTDPKLKHSDPVWQVRWSRDPLQSSVFFSVSSDGRVSSWTLSKNEMLHELVVELKLPTTPTTVLGPTGQEEEEVVVGNAGGSCLALNPRDTHLFVAGTEEGSVHLYTKAYHAQHLRSFGGHHMAVYAVRWNYFHPRIFLTCSADWTVKLWEAGVSKPVLTFDLDTSVGDVAWAPFSSTVFALITTGGKVRVYDIAVNKHEAVGETRVNKKAKLTHVEFSLTEPILAVGDDRGMVTVLKLSPNLRKMSAPSISKINVQEEAKRLEQLLVMPPPDELSDMPPEAAGETVTKKEGEEGEQKAKAPVEED